MLVKIVNVVGNNKMVLYIGTKKSQKGLVIRDGGSIYVLTRTQVIPCTRCAKKGHQKLLQRRRSQNNDK